MSGASAKGVPQKCNAEPPPTAPIRRSRSVTKVLLPAGQSAPFGIRPLQTDVASAQILVVRAGNRGNRRFAYVSHARLRGGLGILCALGPGARLRTGLWPAWAVGKAVSDQSPLHKNGSPARSRCPASLLDSRLLGLGICLQPVPHRSPRRL